MPRRDIKKNGAFTFSGNHANGDILVQSNFSNGGNVDSLTVYQWNSSVTGNLQQLGTCGRLLGDESGTHGGHRLRDGEQEQHGVALDVYPEGRVRGQRLPDKRLL